MKLPTKKQHPRFCTIYTLQFTEIFSSYQNIPIQWRKVGSTLCIFAQIATDGLHFRPEWVPFMFINRGPFLGAFLSSLFWPQLSSAKCTEKKVCTFSTLAKKITLILTSDQVSWLLLSSTWRRKEGWTVDAAPPTQAYKWILTCPSIHSLLPVTPMWGT